MILMVSFSSSSAQDYQRSKNSVESSTVGFLGALNVYAPVVPPAEELKGYYINYPKEGADPSKYIEKFPYTPRRNLSGFFANVDIPVYSEQRLSKIKIYTYSTICLSYPLPWLCWSSRGDRFYDEARITEIYYNFLEITPLFFKYKIVMLGIPRLESSKTEFIESIE